MLQIQFPEPAFRIETRDGQEQIFDRFRRKWVVLTPEEWVRQNFAAYLCTVQQYPESLLAMEKKIKVGEMDKRFDMLVYNHDHQPWMLIECKAPDVTLSTAVLEQVLRYSIPVPAPYLVITNGHSSFGWHKKDGQLVTLDTLPVM